MKLLDKTFSWVIASGLWFFAPQWVQAQVVAPDYQIDGKSVNMIYTSLPFLLISPDARSGALGETGVAQTNDANAMFWNPAKMAFNEDSTSVSISYTPWLRKLVPDINLSYVSIQHKLNERNALGLSLKHFSLGQISIMDGNGASFGSYKPTEFALDAAYSKKLSDNFSLGITFRYIHSNINTGTTADVAMQSKPINTAAADVSAYYKKQTYLLGKDAELAFGINLSNLGSQVTYQKGNVKYYLPANMKWGAAATLFNNLDRFTFSVDFNKLLVPTSPLRDADGNILSGKDTDRSLFGGLFGSFADAPGGFAEELKEISLGFGAEYWIRNQFALRTGYFLEDKTKGNRNYLTAGIGVNYKDRVRLDLGYIIASPQKTPLAQTLRISMQFSINKGNASKKAKSTPAASATKEASTAGNELNSGDKKATPSLKDKATNPSKTAEKPVNQKTNEDRKEQTNER